MGDIVRARLSNTSSQLIGEKKSATNVTQTVFVIVEQVPYVSKDLTVGRAYQCRELSTSQVEIFDQADLTLSREGHDELYSF